MDTEKDFSYADEYGEPDAGRFVCIRCGVPLKEREVHFSYLDHPFHAKLPACPVCGNVMIDEMLAKGKIAEVEGLLEDK